MEDQSNVVNKDNTEFGTNGGSDTVDRVFLLSIDEAREYFWDDNSRIAKLIDSPFKWWLRSPGSTSSYAAFVKEDGNVDNYGSSANNMRLGVRPALWLNLEASDRIVMYKT